MTGRHLFDPGLQPERTELAWRRTALALAAGSLAALRLLPPVLGTWSITIGLAGIATTAALWSSASHRARRIQRALLDNTGPLPDGRLLLVLTALTVIAATLALLYVGVEQQPTGHVKEPGGRLSS
jgi:uncharacterized membrane protein YidH (DUF202 family)